MARRLTDRVFRVGRIAQTAAPCRWYRVGEVLVLYWRGKSALGTVISAKARPRTGARNPSLPRALDSGESRSDEERAPWTPRPFHARACIAPACWQTGRSDREFWIASKYFVREDTYFFCKEAGDKPPRYDLLTRSERNWQENISRAQVLEGFSQIDSTWCFVLREGLRAALSMIGLLFFPFAPVATTGQALSLSQGGSAQS